MELKSCPPLDGGASKGSPMPQSPHTESSLPLVGISRNLVLSELSTGFMHPLNIGVSRIHIHCYSIQLDPWVQNIQGMQRGILKH